MKLLSNYRSEAESPTHTLYSPPSAHEQKAAVPIESDLKMQSGNSSSSHLKKDTVPEVLIAKSEKQLQNKSDVSKDNSSTLEAEDDSVRKAISMMGPQRKVPELLKAKGLPIAPTTNPLIAPGQVVLDKFGNFRLITPQEDKKLSGENQPATSAGLPKAYGGEY